MGNYCYGFKCFCGGGGLVVGGASVSGDCEVVVVIF